MKTLSNYLTEGAAGKNLHLEHIEDEILNYGVPGGRGAINFVRSLRDMLGGQVRKAVNVSVKWDGAPAIIAGIDPADGKFFVGTKGVFAKTPKIYICLLGNLNLAPSKGIFDFSICFHMKKHCNVSVACMFRSHNFILLHDFPPFFQPFFTLLKQKNMSRYLPLYLLKPQITL